MATTGERYTAARRALLAGASGGSAGGGGAPGPRARQWVSQPEMSDESMEARTGRGHNEWADIIEAWADETGGDLSDHTAVAAYLLENFDELDGWWAQAVTVGYERITGLRLPYQRADGSFSCSKSRTVAIGADALRKMLSSEEHRADLFPDQATELRSKPETKALRIAIGPEGAAAIFTIDAVADGRAKVAVQHERLPTYDSVEEWKFYWSDWFDAIADSTDRHGRLHRHRRHHRRVDVAPRVKADRAEAGEPPPLSPTPLPDLADFAPAVRARNPPIPVGVSWRKPVRLSCRRSEKLTVTRRQRAGQECDEGIGVSAVLPRHVQDLPADRGQFQVTPVVGRLLQRTEVIATGMTLQSDFQLGPRHVEPTGRSRTGLHRMLQFRDRNVGGQEDSLDQSLEPAVGQSTGAALVGQDSDQRSGAARTGPMEPLNGLADPSHRCTTSKGFVERALHRRLGDYGTQLCQGGRDGRAGYSIDDHMIEIGFGIGPAMDHDTVE